MNAAEDKVLVVTADDFGASPGINRGIVEGHTHGVVTSTSLMVRGAACREATELARAHPELAIGLHWDLDGEGEPYVDFEDARAVTLELEAQLARFEALMGRPPTHLDSHHHVHQRPEIAPVAGALARRTGLHLRGTGAVTFVGGFYGQWEWQVTDLEHVSVEFLTWILRNEVTTGATELGCHPGYIDPSFQSVYLHEREAELATLTDPRIRQELQALGIRLVSFAQLSAALGSKMIGGPAASP